MSPSIAAPRALPQGHHRLRALAALLAVAVIANACGGASQAPSEAAGPTPATSADPASMATVDALRAVPYGEANTEALIEALGRSGIAVVEDVQSPDPVRPVEGAAAPLRFTRWQAHAMGLEAATGGGLTGAELDALVPVPEGMPRTSRIVAGYLARVDSPGARLGRALLGERDWAAADDIVFPGLVLATLSAELAREATAAKGPMEPSLATRPGPLFAARGGVVLPGGAPPAAGPGICSAVESFVEDTVSAVFDALKVESDDSTLGDIVTGIWNFLVEIAEAVVETALEAITAPVVAVIRAVAGAVAVVASIVAIIQPWALRVTGEPALTRLAIGNEPGLPGVFSAEVDVGGLDDWPSDVADCAAAAGVPLPPLGAVGAQIEWKPFGQSPGGLMSSGEADAAMPEDGPGVIATTTGSEPPEVADGEQAVGLVRSDVTVKRPGIRELMGRLQSLLFAQLPDIVAAALAPILGPIIGDLVGELADIQDVKGTGFVSVIYHIEPEETPTSEATQTRPADVRHPCDYVSPGDLNTIAEGNWSASHKDSGVFRTCQFDDPGAQLIPPSFAVVSISTSYPSWDDIAKGPDAERIGGLGDEAYMTGAGQVLFVRKGSVVISTSVADMIVEDADRGDFEVDADADRQKAIALAQLVVDKLP